MDETSKDRILKVLEQGGVPIAAIAYAVTVAVQLRDALDKFGWRVVSIAVLVACVAWAVYVWTAKRPSNIDPTHLVPQYGWKIRFAALVATMAALLPTWYMILPSGPRVPFLTLKVTNTKNAPLQISPFGLAYFTVVDISSTDHLIQITKVRLASAEQSTGVMVPAGGSVWLTARFLNEAALVPLLEREDVALRVIFTTSKGTFSQAEFPFTREDLTNQHMELEIREPDMPVNKN